MNRIANRITVLMLMGIMSINVIAQKLESDIREAAKDGKADLVQRFLQEGASVNSQDSKGQTALMLAAEKGHVDIVNILLKKGAKIDVADNKGESALNKARKKNKQEVVIILEFAQAEKDDTIKGYEVFLNGHSEGLLAQSAKKNIARLKIEEAFLKAKTDNTVQSYLEFIEKHGASEYLEKIEDRVILNEVRNLLLLKKMAIASLDQASSMFVDFVKDNSDMIETKYKEPIRNILDILSAKSEEDISEASLNKMRYLDSIYGKKVSYEGVVFSEMLFFQIASQQKKLDEKFLSTGFDNVIRNAGNHISAMRGLTNIKTLNFVAIVAFTKDTNEVNVKLRGWKSIERILMYLDLNKLKERDQKEGHMMPPIDFPKDVNMKYDDIKTTLARLANIEEDEKVRVYALKVVSILK